MTSLRIDAPAHPEPAGTLRALARALLDVSPQEALAALPKYARVLGHAFPELLERTNRDDTMVRLPKEAAERWALVQRTFTVDDGDEARSRTSYAAMLLTLRRDDDLVVVGAIALIAGVAASGHR